MHRVTWVLAIAFVVMSLPVNLHAQEEQPEEEPPVLRLSFFKCDLGEGAGEAIEQELESQVIPVWNEIVAEDMGIMDYGYIYHWWADEWNVGIYTIAESIQAVVDAEQEAGDRLEERFGDGPGAFGPACPEHRDGFYTMGPSTGDDENQE